MDSLTVSALVVTILFCADGSPTLDGCANGAPKEQHEMTLLSRQASGKEVLFEFDENGVPKFILGIDGSITRAGDFHVDDAALSFWRAIANTYKEACPSLSTILDPISKGDK